MDWTAVFKSIGEIVLGRYSTETVFVAKFTEALTIPSKKLKILSTLTAQAAQVMSNTGKDFLIVGTPYPNSRIVLTASGMVVVNLEDSITTLLLLISTVCDLI